MSADGQSEEPRVDQRAEARRDAYTAGRDQFVFQAEPAGRCECGIYAVGACRVCDLPVCDRHGAWLNGQLLLCDAHAAVLAQEPQNDIERIRPIPGQFPGVPPAPVVLGGIRGKNALRRATLAGLLWFGGMAVVFRAQGPVNLSGLGIASFIFGLLMYLFLLTQKSDTFIFSWEALRIRGPSRWTGIRMREMTVRWDSVERIRVERGPLHTESGYSIVVWFHTGCELPPALMRKYGGWLEMFGGEQRQDRGCVIYRSGYRRRDGVPFSQLNEILPRYVGRRYESSY